jgi:H+/Cl- antiporter ClcA
MNGAEAKIEIFKPFGEAFDLMKKILFQPFDFTKWLVIGFAAFLCGHFSVGGFNFPFGGFPQNQKNPKLISRDWEQWKPWLPIAIGAFVVVILILIVVLSWLRARGNFIFTDCIVRNRAAIAEPWREFCKEGNSYFLFLLALAFGSIVLVGIFLLPVLALSPVFQSRCRESPHCHIVRGGWRLARFGLDLLRVLLRPDVLFHGTSDVYSPVPGAGCLSRRSQINCR